MDLFLDGVIGVGTCAGIIEISQCGVAVGGHAACCLTGVRPLGSSPWTSFSSLLSTTKIIYLLGEDAFFFFTIFGFLRSMEKWPQMAPNRAGRIFSY